MKYVQRLRRHGSRLSKSGWARALGSVLTLLGAMACGASDPEPEAMAPPKTAACASLTQALPAITPDPAGRVTGEPADKIASIYDQSVLRTFELKLSEKDLAFLDANPSAEKYVPGSLVYEGKEYGPVGIRYKGSIGAWVFCVADSTPENPTKIGGAKTCPKLSMKVSFNEYDSKGSFFGVKKLVFHAMNLDDSLMRERLGYWLYRQMGVPASRAVHARLLTNGKYQGVFLNVEEVDGSFAKAHFSDGDGNLYKEIWPTAVAGLTAPLSAERWRSGLQTNKDKKNSFDRMLELGRSVMQESGDGRARAIRDWMSVTNSLRFVAVDRTIRADDGPTHYYCEDGGCWSHNFYVYEEEKSPRAWLIPWDLDNSFVVGGSLGNVGDQFLRVVTEWNDHSVVCRPSPGDASFAQPQLPPACDPLWNALGCYYDGEYKAALMELLAGPFSERVVEEKLVAWQAQITKAVDEAYAADNRQLTAQAWSEGLADLRARIKYLREQAMAGLRR